MAELDLKRVQSELAAAPLVSPWPLELAVAAINDLFRHAAGCLEVGVGLARKPHDDVGRQRGPIQ